MYEVDVITGFHPEGYEQYGRNCVESFVKYWPDNYHLICYMEKFESVSICIEQRLQSNIKGLDAFLEFTDRYDIYKGLSPVAGWKSSEVSNGYSYRFDAHKFCKMAFILYDGFIKSKADYVIWLDGDTVTFDDVPLDLCAELLPKGKAVAYLGRKNKHSECGFLLFDRKRALPIVERYRNYFYEHTVFDLKEWHSSFCFDAALLDEDPELLHNMTPEGKGHVWFQSPLGKFMDHLKGDRKLVGYSKERFKQ